MKSVYLKIRLEEPLVAGLWALAAERQTTLTDLFQEMVAREVRQLPPREVWQGAAAAKEAGR